MIEAGVLRCPSCGAAITAGSRRCAHCDAPVATVRCAHCFHMSASDAIHCAGCGRELGLEPIARDGALLCPDCRVPMSLMDCGPGTLYDCGRCRGQFVDHDALRDLVERHDRLDVVGGRRRPPACADTQVRYVACPVCGAMMNRRNFGASSGVIIDVCAKHGTWLDPGELPRVLSFVEAGGLARARRREEEAAVRREREERIHSAAAPRSAPVGVCSARTEEAVVATSLVVDLLSFLFD
jgi:Zn-finger nucleic acid-binding protein